MSASAVLLEQVKDGLPEDLRQTYFDACPWRGVHLAVMNEPYLSLLLDGRKTIESRLSRNRAEPFGHAEVGDLVVLKAGLVVGAFTVSTTDFRDLRTHDVSAVRADLNDQIMAEDDFWELKADASYATLLGVGEVFAFPAFPVSKRDMRGWVVLRPAVRTPMLTW